MINVDAIVAKSIPVIIRTIANVSVWVPSKGEPGCATIFVQTIDKI
jgi:hypothetical protein